MIIKNYFFLTALLFSQPVFSDNAVYNTVNYIEDIIYVGKVSLTSNGATAQGDLTIRGSKFCKSKEWFCTTGFGGLAFPKKSKNTFKKWTFMEAEYKILSQKDLAYGANLKQFPKIGIVDNVESILFIKQEIADEPDLSTLLIISEGELIAYVEFDHSKCKGNILGCHSMVMFAFKDDNPGLGSKNFDLMIPNSARDKSLESHIKILK